MYSITFFFLFFFFVLFPLLVGSTKSFPSINLSSSSSERSSPIEGGVGGVATLVSTATTGAGGGGGGGGGAGCGFTFDWLVGGG